MLERHSTTVASDPDLRDAVAMLFNAYPVPSVEVATREVYAHALADLDPGEVETAVLTAIHRNPRLPSVAEIRQLVAERALGLPADVEAWETVLRYANEPASVHCPTCNGSGLRDAETRHPVEVPDDIAPGIFRQFLERIARTGLVSGDLCPACRDGRVPNPRRPPLDATVRRALDAVGGAAAVRDPDNMEVLRAQFLKMYAAFRRLAIDEANLASASLQISRGRDTARELTTGGNE